MTGAVVPQHWLPIPTDLVDEERLLSWTMGVVDTLSHAWGAQWDESHRRPLAELLYGVGGSRDVDDGPAFLAWPLPGPVTTSIAVSVVASSTLPAWEAEGYRVLPYLAEHLGPGILCTRERFVGEGDDVLALAEATYAFDDGAICVVVSVGECVARLAAFLDGDLERMLQSMRVVDAHGTDFMARPSRAVVAGSYDGWVEDAS